MTNQIKNKDILYSKNYNYPEISKNILDNIPSKGNCGAWDLGDYNWVVSNNKWIKKPKYNLPEVDKHLITTKVNKYLDIFNKISMMDNSIKKVDSYNKVFEKIVLVQKFRMVRNSVFCKVF